MICLVVFVSLSMSDLSHILMFGYFRRPIPGVMPDLPHTILPNVLLPLPLSHKGGKYDRQ